MCVMSQEGLAQAELVAVALKDNSFTTAYSSDLQRAKKVRCRCLGLQAQK
jgi:broad specificity phosphatase PhoE